MDKRLLVNGTGMTVLTPITKVMAHLPLTLLGRPAEKTLVICFGMGTTFRSMMSWDLRTTAVELIPSVPKVYGYFHADGPKPARIPAGPSRHRRWPPIPRTLRRAVRHHRRRSPPPPVSAPTSRPAVFHPVLRHHEAAHLKPGGIVQVWFPGGDDATLGVHRARLPRCLPLRAHLRIHRRLGHSFPGTHGALPEPHRKQPSSPRRLPARAAADLIEWQDGENRLRDDDPHVLDGEKKVDDLIGQRCRRARYIR